jgi:hypothetical protein
MIFDSFVQPPEILDLLLKTSEAAQFLLFSMFFKPEGLEEQLFRKLFDVANAIKNFEIFRTISKAVLEAKDLTVLLTLFLHVVRVAESPFVLVFCESPFFTAVQNFLIEHEDL